MRHNPKLITPMSGWQTKRDALSGLQTGRSHHMDPRTTAGTGGDNVSEPGHIPQLIAFLTKELISLIVLEAASTST
jgi:hypothetical protein